MRTILGFGKYKGKSIPEIDDDFYLQWLAKPTYTGKYYKSIHSTELNWKVPFNVKIAARAELEKRNYILIGERWESKNE